MVTRAIGVTSVWDLIPDDAELYGSVFQEHFADTNLQVIAIFKVRPPEAVSASHVCNLLMLCS
jgi:hypothetical protein